MAQNSIGADNVDHNEGATISNLHIINSGTGSMSLRLGADQDYTLIDAVEVEVTGTGGGGIQAQSGSGNTLNAGSDGLSSFVTIRNSYIHDVPGVGALVDANPALIEGNTFSTSRKVG